MSLILKSVTENSTRNSSSCKLIPLRTSFITRLTEFNGSRPLSLLICCEFSDRSPSCIRKTDYEAWHFELRSTEIPSKHLRAYAGTGLATAIEWGEILEHQISLRLWERWR